MPWVLVLEDDIRFCEQFDERLTLALGELPEDWGALWLGGQVMKSASYSRHLRRLVAGTGGYGIIFRETMYADLLMVLDEQKFQADVSYMKLQEKYKCFRTVDNLVLHTPGFSTILKKHVSYPHLEQ